MSDQVPSFSILKLYTEDLRCSERAVYATVKTLYPGYGHPTIMSEISRRVYQALYENGWKWSDDHPQIWVHHGISSNFWKKKGETYAKQTHTYPTYIPWNPYFLSGWCPPVIGWFRNSINKFVISTINHRIQPLISQLNAIERGPHPVHWHRFWVPSQAPTLGMLKTR